MVKLSPYIFCLRFSIGGARLRARLHNFIRLKTCPYAIIERYIPPEGDIYDLGCGYGTLINFISRDSNRKQQMTGFDIDAGKIKLAALESKNQNARFEIRDIKQDVGIAGAACVILADVLMFLPFKEQEKLLNRCLSYLSSNGYLIIKDVDTRPFWKYAWHHIQEIFVLRVFRLIKGDGLYCRSRKSFVSLLEGMGYAVNVRDAQKGYAYPHILYICAKLNRKS